MEKSIVFVVIDLGTDNVVGVFKSAESAKEHYQGYMYYLQALELQD